MNSDKMLSLFISAILYIPLGIYAGFTLSVLWGWFILPVFPELPEITTMAGFGIMFVIAFFRNGITETLILVKMNKLVKDEHDDYQSAFSSLFRFITITFFLVLGGILNPIIN